MATTDESLTVADLADLPRVNGMQVIVRQETPFLPKVAFTLITLASLAGAVLTGVMAGLEGFPLFARWLTLWSVGLAGGFAVWRVFYLRDSDPEASQRAVTALNRTALARADRVGRVVGAIALLGTVGPLATYYLGLHPTLRWTLVGLQLVLAGALFVGIDRPWVGTIVAAASLGLIAGWAYADAGWGASGALRLAHLTAFSLWLGGAVWNIWVAMQAGREHPNVDAVIAGAHQLDRFRWVVRFALPTIIVTGLIMAGFYRMFPLEWWLHFPGVLIPAKVGAIIVLVVVFITCPLFRHCSPVQGVCNLDDLEDEPSNARP